MKLKKFDFTPDAKAEKEVKYLMRKFDEAGRAMAELIAKAGSTDDLSEADLAAYNEASQAADRYAKLLREAQAENPSPNINPAQLTGPVADPIRGSEAKSARYRDLFGEPRGADGFSSLREFVKAVEQRDGSKLKTYFDAPEQRALGTAPPSAGGFLLPETYAAQIFDLALESEIVRPRARIWPMGADTLHIPAVANSDHSSSLYGGVVGEWLAEAGIGTPQDPSFRRMTLAAKKLMVYMRASSELLEGVADASYAADPLDAIMAGAISWFLDYAFIHGTGAGMPLGILNSPCLVTVDKEAGQPADTVLYENLSKMFARQANPMGSVWLINRTAIPQLLQLSVTIGVAGSHVPVLSQSGGTFTILTRPVIFTEKLPTMGSVGDIIFADLSQYAVGMRKELTLERSNAVSWLTDQVDWRGRIRVDGQPLWSEPMTPKAGDTLSPFVVLESRT